MLAASATALMLGAGCSSPPEDGSEDTAGRSIPSAAPTPPSIQVDGLADCTSLKTRARATGGETLPQLTLPCLTERSSVAVNELAGRPTVVNLWATWCGPCREEMPLLADAHEDLKEQVQFVGVDTKDSSRAAADFLVETGVTYAQLVDLDGLLLSRLRVQGLPVTLVVDARGNVVDKQIGPVTRGRLDTMVQAALRQP